MTKCDFFSDALTIINNKKMFNIGDQVSVLDEDINGVVVAVKDNTIEP
jgi:hypothetical protein